MHRAEERSGRTVRDTRAAAERTQRVGIRIGKQAGTVIIEQNRIYESPEVEDLRKPIPRGPLENFDRVSAVFADAVKIKQRPKRLGDTANVGEVRYLDSIPSYESDGTIHGAKI